MTKKHIIPVAVYIMLLVITFSC